MSGITIIVIEAIAPLLILIIYGRIKIARNRRKAEAGEETPAPLFDPKPEPSPNAFLRRFSIPQRAYLRQQIALGKALYFVAAWGYIIFFTSGLLPPFVNQYGTAAPLAQRVWYSYLLHNTVVTLIFGIMLLMAALVAVGGVVNGASAIFNRTRPLTLRFLFWARILPALATILCSLLTGMVLSFVLLLVFYGPVWLHLSDPAPLGVALNNTQLLHLVQVQHTSAPRIFLSIATTAILIFAICTALISQPFGFFRKRAGTAMVAPIAAFAGIMGAQLVHYAGSPFINRISRAFFIYSTLGTPPPYALVIVPVLVSAALLFLAQFCMPRTEP